MLYVMSKLLVKVICAVYLHKNEKQALISYLNFYARRENIVFSVADVEPIETVDQLKDTFVQFKLNNMDGKMYYSLKYGKATDKDGLLKIIGGLKSWTHYFKDEYFES